MNINYILNSEGDPVPARDVLEWAKWFEAADRHVAKDDITGGHISTVFLGIDHNFGSGPPVLFETMIFGGRHDQWQDRYCTREEALAGHAAAVAMVKAVTPN